MAIVAGGGGKNRTKSGSSILAFALPDQSTETTELAIDVEKEDEGWIDLFDGKTLEGWVHMNGSHSYSVEEGAIVGRTMAGSKNSFLCTQQEFGDFQLELETMVDDVTNQGIQFRSSVRPVSERDHHNWRAGRVWGPQMEVRRNFGEGKFTTGILYGEALGTGWLSSKEKQENGHDHFISGGWNRISIIAEGPRIRTWVNGHLVEDLVREDVYKTHPKGFIGLQIHGIDGERQFVMKWRNIQIWAMD